MPSILPIASLLLLAAIMPGPNNLVMVRAGSLGDARAALSAMAGVVLGGAVVLVLTAAGLGVLLARWPLLRTFIAVGGATYLIWLGWRLMHPQAGVDGKSTLPAGAAGLFAFQFLNPNAWVMMATVTSHLPDGGMAAAVFRLVPLFAGISLVCSLLWVVAGRALMSRMAQASTRAWIDRVLGASLMASTLLLFA